MVVALVFSLCLIAGGILGLSSIIIAKKPEAKTLIAQLVPYQAGIGATLLGLGIYNLIRLLPLIGDFFKASAFTGITILGALVVAILLGFFFGMPLIAKWIPGDAPAEEKAESMAKKLGPFQTILGGAGVVFGLLFLIKIALA
jgi:hypothetical protein